MTPDESLLSTFIAARLDADPAHDLAHVQRVVDTARRLAQAEGADLEVVIPAAWLHDCVSLPKNHPERHLASRQAAAMARDFLREHGVTEPRLGAIAHAIEAHSFSAGIAATTLEAQVVQDADRLDALGAVGIARCLLTGGAIGRPLYAPDDPFCVQREPDDAHFCIDHFYRKLFAIGATLHTASARTEAAGRLTFMRQFLVQLGLETGHSPAID
ncbi:HD domain-containing protein [Nitrogeniibacter mangrovi]|uniref:HD domain-containing protein n=1 Tax=Nitrogeniibacter mangrovi TaxID=2016596 RepID=A0A6C1B401_9RHOO|nr:HD domain-containing protein [Nitrogeniibacter mangrovi]QID18386.1 HD domain-containing protein [Nitrogeniibacter mangrovi]